MILQTYSPDHYAIRAAAAQDYDAFYEQEIVLRDQLGYPPFSDLVLLVIAADSRKKRDRRLRKSRTRSRGVSAGNTVLSSWTETCAGQ